MKEELTIRRATAGDVDALKKIEDACFPVPWSREAFAQEMEKNKLAYYLVAEKDGETIGYAGLWLIAGEGDITNVAVLPEYQRRGVASRLLEALLDQTERLGANAHTLEVRKSNVPALGLYQAYGFTAEGVRKGYYQDGEDAIIMWRHSHSGEER